MNHKRLTFVLFLIATAFLTIDAFSLISPVRRDQNGKLFLVNCNDIRLVSQEIKLYHHPLGIWCVSCVSKLQNLYPRKKTQEMGFNSGFDINTVEGDLYCDEFNNFKVSVDDTELTDIKFKQRCLNYVERIGIEWTNDDRTGIGFLNTWKVNFKPEETKKVKITFTFIVKKPSLVFKPDLKEAWYVELMTWLREEYSKRAENEFVLPLNMGSFWALFVDSLSIKIYNSKKWFMLEEENKRKYTVISYNFCEPIDLFSPPPVELHDLTEDDLKDLSSTELIILRNSFFAKYGRKFDVKWLNLYFKKQPWYYVNPDYNNWYLTDFDLKNIKFIHQYEKQGK